MDTAIIDRRRKEGVHSGTGKSLGNTERFKRRYRDQIRDAARKAVSDRGIKDVFEKGTDVTIPKRDIREPVFGHSRQGGVKDIVHPGNKDFIKGDKIERPKGGGGGGSGKGEASDSGEGNDDFTFTLSKEDILEIFFEDCELPNLLKRQSEGVDSFKTARAGFQSSGNPSDLSVIRTMRQGLGRKIALKGARNEHIRILTEQFNAEIKPLVDEFKTADEARKDELRGIIIPRRRAFNQEITDLRNKRIPFLDPIDQKFRNRKQIPNPISKAVMFCLMDVSGSMDENRKDIAKRFFTTLYLFLNLHKYDKVDIVFVRHHTKASEVDEKTFFYDTETGGTIVSSALELTDEIIDKRYPLNEWNILIAQASDGDNWSHDSERCKEIIEQRLLKKAQWMGYVQVAEAEQDLWDIYAKIAEDNPEVFAMVKALERRDIHPVFKELFKKRGIEESRKPAAAAYAPAP